MSFVVFALVTLTLGSDGSGAASAASTSTDPAPASAPAAEPPAWPEPVELAPVELPKNVDEALGVEGASPLRRAGIASLVTGGLLGVVSAGAFSMGFEAERALRAETHTRAQADALLFERAVAAAIAYPALVLGAAGVAAGATCLLWDDQAGLSDGNEEVTQ